MKKTEVDWCFTHRRDTLIEGRLLDLTDAQDQRAGTLLGLWGVFVNFVDKI